MKAFIRNEKIWEEYMRSKTALISDESNVTYKVYNSNMKLFIVWLRTYDKTYILDGPSLINNMIDTLEAYIVYCRKELGNNNRTINNKITALSSLYLWMVKRGKIQHHPFLHKMDRLRCTDTDKRRESIFLTQKEIEKVDILLELKTSKLALENRVMWGLFIDSGARINAIQNIKYDQIDLNEMVIRDVREKGGKIVDLMFFDNTATLLKELIEKNNSKGDSKNTYIFSNKKGDKPICQSSMRYRIKTFGKMIGYNDKLYPHTLRKTAINLLYSKTDLDTAAEFANHNDTATTKGHYVDKKNNKEFRSKIRSTMK